uniref:Uncharacterized protein n=1 Tax=Octopus bimaculoides TaxID=37653 RepID=A0A0L8I8D5_OCTBM
MLSSANISSTTLRSSDTSVDIAPNCKHFCSNAKENSRISQIKQWSNTLIKL